MTPRRAGLALAGLLVTLVVSAALAASGSHTVRLDRTFGGGRGFVTTPVAGTAAVAYGAVALPNGDTVIAGQASPPSGRGQIIVARYLPGGGLDRSFASGGIFRSALPAAQGPYLATAIVREPRTNKLLVAGGYGLGSMLVMRLTARGRLDRSFGPHRSGFAKVAVGGIANSIAVARDGKILLGGSNANRNGRPFVVARFTRAGMLDRVFGHGGVAQSLFWMPSAASSAGVNSLVPTSDGGVIATGHIDYIGGSGGGSGGHGAAGVFRLTARGQPKRAFGSQGHTQITFFSRTRVPQSWYPCAAGVDGQGRITVTGGGGTHRSALLTQGKRGRLDRNYGAARNGRTSTPGLGGNAITTCGLAVMRSGQITVGLQSRLAQLLANGKPNTRFARRGVFKIAKPSRVFINALVMSGSRRLLAAGSSANVIYLARYLLPSR